jgi:hypothetical protein
MQCALRPGFAAALFMRYGGTGGRDPGFYDAGGILEGSRFARRRARLLAPERFLYALDLHFLLFFTILFLCQVDGVEGSKKLRTLAWPKFRDCGWQGSSCGMQMC